MKSFMAAHPDPSAAVYRREALNIRVGKDVAWVSFDQYAPGSAGAFFDLPEATNEMRILEKDAEGWKIAGSVPFTGRSSTSHRRWSASISRPRYSG